MSSIEIKGADKIARDFEQYPAKAVKVYAKAVSRATEKLRDMTKRLPPVSAERTGYAAKGIPVAPKNGGTLRQSIQKKQISLLAAGVTARTNYAEYVHQGTARMPARPFFEWSLELGAEEEIDRIFADAISQLP